ncbi:transcriptional regulator [Bradyrhizobium sp. C-145]|uniref:transcriptional regulator n=1 Tax=Bradyrhizobium sp. C-145 TaxID=574727 RepID=UPI00201B9385|nr:transcriptional regulator [Bradyrhizobium sp. C-145]UQR64351.1 transcriptional regulator [Bradyrhizobium sp. C-145]
MIAKKSGEPSPEGIARSNRKRLFAEDGARALADAERQAIEVRRNMARLRELREANEVAEIALRASLPVPAPRKRKNKPAR